MCGHVGIAGKLEFRDEAVLKRLLIYDYFRGPDSTGFASLRNTGEVKVAKIASHPIDLFDSKRFNDALNGAASSVFLGHNRSATKGLVNHINTHPYEFDHIVGAHNGTLEDSSWKALEENLDEKYTTDSMAVIAHIAKFGIEKTVPLLCGAWALVWIDTKEKTLNFLRNKERSFWYAYSEKLDKIFWASEWHMIEAAAKSGLTDQPLFLDVGTDGKTYKGWQTEENFWYRYDIEELRKGAEKKWRPRVKKLEGKEPAPVVSYYNGNGYQSPLAGTWPKKDKTTSTGSTIGSSNKDTDKVVRFKASKDNPLGGCMTKRKFDEIAPHGS